jgi:hypothetical protein
LQEEMGHNILFFAFSYPFFPLLISQIVLAALQQFHIVIGD